MEHNNSRGRSSTTAGGLPSSSNTKGYYKGRGTTPDNNREKVIKEAVASVIVNERTKYESKIQESQTRLTRSQMEADRLLDEVSNLRLQIREMKNDRSELVRAHQESMSLLAQVSEEKLVEIKSRSEQEAVESRVAQEEALRTVLEMMEKDCADRVAELDNELARVEEEKEHATRLQLEAVAKAEEEGQTKAEIEEAARIALQKLVEERAARDEELQMLAEREKQLKYELAMTKQKVERDTMLAIAAHEQSVASSVGTSSGESTDTSRSVGSQSKLTNEEDDKDERRPPVINRRSVHKYSDSPFLDDPTYEMTLGRRIALSLQVFSWYQPRGRHWDVEGLGLQSAWAYFEHSILPRYIVKNSQTSLLEDDKLRKRSKVDVYTSEAESTDGEDDDNTNNFTNDSNVDDWLDRPKMSPVRQAGGGQKIQQKGDLERAKPGESTMPTRLYSPLFTPLSQLGDFGIGVGLYFSYLRAVSFITLIAGCINLPNIFYYASDEYSKRQPGVLFPLKGSAICTEQAWVPCPSCTVDDFHFARNRVAGTTTVTPDGELQTLVFALKNSCDGARLRVGIFNMASLGFILLAMVVLTLYQRRKQVTFDEQEQTAQDYSIEITNPPADATEPEEWQEFFESRFGGHVTCCTVTINNDLLIKALVERREVLSHLEEKLKDGTMIDPLKLSELAAKEEHNRLCKSRLSPGMPELVGRLIVLNARIQGLAQQEYRATRVFCTFETESIQVQVLYKMAVGTFTSSRNRTHKINSNLLFRGEHVLHVREPEEPNCIRWTDLDCTLAARLRPLFATTVVSLLCIVAVAVVVYFLRRKSAIYAAVAISVANAIYPMIAKALTSLEPHNSMTGLQISLLIKITTFRWVVTAIIITIITPFTSTITNGPEHLIQSVYVIFLADLVTSNVLQLADVSGNFQRHFLAPRAGSQERMNLLMSGAEYSIAERYTNVSKALFLAFFYCGIYPSVFFLCAITLFVNFFVDKFCLMRTWKPSPLLGSSIASFSRVYTMNIAIVVLAFVSSYFYSGFPYDNLCAENVSHSAYYGTWRVTDGKGGDSDAVIEPGMRSYHFCNQFLGGTSFPALPTAQPSGSTWMTPEQEQLTSIYGWVSVGVVGLIGLYFLFGILLGIKRYFSASHSVDGNIHGVSFSQVKSISTYIPQIKSDDFTRPLLAVNIDSVDKSIFDWSDPERSHSYYDLTRDAEQLLKGNEDFCQTSFGQIRHWPPGGDSSKDDRFTKSALRRSKKDINPGRNNVSWSSKVTCKTYSKDDPNYNDSFNANASTTEGMNFKRHVDPLYDPHAQNEARVYREDPVPIFDPYDDDDLNRLFPNGQATPIDPNNTFIDTNNQNNQYDQLPQPPPNQYFDQYYGVGLDDANQPPDPMYGDSQHQPENLVGTDNWERSDSNISNSSGASRSTGSGSRGSYSGNYSADSPYVSNGSHSSNSGSYSSSDNVISEEVHHPIQNPYVVEYANSDEYINDTGDQDEHFEEQDYDQNWGEEQENNNSYSTGSSRGSSRSSTSASGRNSGSGTFSRLPSVS